MIPLGATCPTLGRVRNQWASWLSSYPELETRQDLVRFFLSDHQLAKGFRHITFAHLQRLVEYTYYLPEQTALYTLGVVYKAMREQIHETWHDRLAFEGLAPTYNEAAGVIRNVYINCMSDIQEYLGRPPFQLRNEHDIRVNRKSL